MWMAGGGIRGGQVYGETDDFSYNVVDKPVHIHDLNATILHMLGVNHERLTYRFQGRDFRLTDIHGNVMTDLLRSV
jgi:arylsulfatase A-like enzyme